MFSHASKSPPFLIIEFDARDIWRVVPRVLKHLDAISIESITEAISESIHTQGMRFVAMQAFGVSSKRSEDMTPISTAPSVDREFASAYMMEYPGKLASLVGPALANDPRLQSHPEAQKAILVALINRAREWGVELVQAVIDHDTPFPTSSLLEAGLSKLSSLDQMVVDFPLPQGKLDLLLASQNASAWRRYSPKDKDAWIDWMDATYEQTADCPELNGLRTTLNTLDGYLASAGTMTLGVPNPEWWALFEDNQPIADSSPTNPKIVAAFMLSNIGNSFWELSYMGVAISHRGRGLGHHTLGRAMTRAQELKAKRLTLAVDCRNSFAIRLYREYGFHRTRRLEAWFLPFHNTNAANNF